MSDLGAANISIDFEIRSLREVVAFYGSCWVNVLAFHQNVLISSRTFADQTRVLLFIVFSHPRTFLRISAL